MDITYLTENNQQNLLLTRVYHLVNNACCMATLEIDLQVSYVQGKVTVS